MTQHATIERTWHGVPLTEGERTAILERVREIARLLQDPSKVNQLASQTASRSRYRFSLSSAAHSHSLAIGPLGLALFFEEMDRALPGEGWDDIAHSYLAQAQEHVSPAGPASPGLFSGASGLLFTTLHLTRSPENSQPLVASILAGKSAYVIPHDVPRPATYSLSSGVVGIGAALLTLAEQAPSDTVTQARLCLEGLVHHLSWLALRDRGEAIDQFAHWYPDRYLQEAQARWLPEMAFCGLGMRQGLSGWISLLSLVLESDLHIDEGEVVEALDVLCTRMRNEITSHDQGWLMTQETEGDHDHRPGTCAPFAWCDGASGMARALWLAGRALRDEELTLLAHQGLAQAIHSFTQEPRRFGPSLCHGIAGLLQVSTRFAGENENLDLTEDIQAMLQRLLELFEPDRPFGYRTFEPEYIRVDTPWLLNGASGVGLGLLSLLSPVAPTWDRLLLLS